MQAHLYLAGCGPYSEDYTTAILHDTIASSDVILYDRLINKALLSHAKKDVIIEYVGKDVNEKTNTQANINKQILTYLQQNKRVLRLKSGDPFLFGRGFEEYEIAKSNNFPVTVLPGMSSSLAIASAIGLPLTLRDVSQGITILTGTNAHNEIPAYTFQNTHHSYVFLMSVRNFASISQQMIASGFAKTTPAIAISNGTYPNQQIVCSTLQHLHQKMKKYNQANPAIIIVSPTIPYWQKYYHPKILSTKIDGTDFPELDKKYACDSHHFPLLNHESLTLSEIQLKQLHDATTIILSSPITTNYAKLLAINWEDKQIIAIGPKTKVIADSIFSNVNYYPDITSLDAYINKHSTNNTVILTSSYGKDIRIDTEYLDIIIPIFSLFPTNMQIPPTTFDAITVYSPSSLQALISTIENNHIAELFSIPLFCFGKNVYNVAIQSAFISPILIETNQHDIFYQHIHSYFKERFSL